MLSRENTIKLVQSFAREIKGTGINLKKVYLYGSYAKNEQKEFSDIDVAIIADEFTGFGFEDIKYFVNIHLKKNYYLIQPKTYPPEYFEKGDPFIDEIKKTGIGIDFE